MSAWILVAVLASGVHAADRTPAELDALFDGAFAALGGPGDGPSIFDNQPVVLQGHAKRVEAVDFAGDSVTVVTAGWDDTARMWDRTTGVQLRSYALSGPPDGAAFSADGALIAIAGSAGTEVFEAKTGRVLRKLRKSARSVAFSPDGAWLATGRWQDASVWNVKTGDEKCHLDHDASVMDVSFSRDGSRFLTAGRDGKVRVFSLASCRELVQFRASDEGLNTAAFGPDATRIVTGALRGVVQIWDLQTRKPLVTFKGHTKDVTMVGYSPDGKVIVSTSLDKTARVWRADTGQTIKVLPHGEEVRSAAFSPDGTRLAVAAGSTVTIWRVAYTPEEMAEIRRQLEGRAKPADENARGRFKLPPDASKKP